MKTLYLYTYLTIFLFLIGMPVMAEDFVTVYYHDGTHKMFFVSDIERIHMSHLDLDSVAYSDYRSQVVETTYGTYMQMINQIDSVVFSHVDMTYPRTNEELEATTQLADVIAVRSNDIVESLTREGKRDPVLIVNEFMKIPGVIDAEVDDDLYSITMLRVDSIYHHFILSNDNTIQGHKSITSKANEKKQLFIPKNEIKQSQTIQTAPLHEDGETKTMKEIKNVLILAPFENWDGKGQYDNDVVKLSEDIKELLNVEPIVLLDDKADITKFYGDYLDNFDMVIISTHGGAGKASKWNGTYTYTKEMDKYGVSYLSYSLGSETNKLNNLPEIRYGQLEGSIKYRLCMTPKFLEKASFNGSVIFSYACHGFDGMIADDSMTRSFLEHGASSFFGSIEIVKNILNKSVSNNIIRSFCAGAPLQDAFSYWKNCSMTAFYYLNEIDFYNKYKDKVKFEDDWLYQQNPEILKNQPKSTYPIYSKSPYPFNLKYDNSKGSFSWDSNIHSFTSIVKTAEEITEGDYITTGERHFQYIPTYDIYVNGRKINDEELTDSHFSWKPNISGTYRWFVVTKMKNELGDNEYISTFKSNEETFTMESYPPLAFSSNSITVSALTSSSVQIISGSGNYSIESVYPEGIITAYINGNIVSIEAKTVGTAVITVKDNITGETATITVSVTGIVDTRELMFTKRVGSAVYSVYKKTLSDNDYHINPDGWKCYRSELSLDITKNGNTNTYVVDNNIYLDKKYDHHGGQQPCMLLDFNKNMMYIFCNSKDDGPYYSMDGNFYSSSMNNIHFSKETVFEGANWGWYPYFCDYGDDNIYLCNFSFAGYFTIMAVREGNTWELYYYNTDISPEQATREWEIAGPVLVIGQEEVIDERIPTIIPDEIRDEIEQYIPIYDGVDPPNIEGTYYLSPQILIGSSQSKDQIGKEYSSEYQKYSNQDMTKNTIDMVRMTVTETEWAKGSGAFISGSGNNFTIYFDQVGESSGILVKQAYIVSGTKTSNGIKNLTTGFIMKEKGPDPDHKLVDVGTYRFFKDKDGMSEATSWPYGTQYGTKKRVKQANSLPNPLDR